MRVLIADDMHESIIPLLKESGFDPVYLPIIDRQGILEVIDGFDGLIIRSKTSVDQELIDAGTRLQFVARAGAGLDKVDKDYLTSKGVKMINAPEGNKDSLGEHTLGLLLSLLHRINYSDHQVKQGIWDREANRGIELNGKVVGIYGVGNMGKAFASKLTGLGCEVIGYDIKSQVECQFLTMTTLEQFMDQTEILSIHIPLKDDTRLLFDKKYLSAFKNLKVLINTARGEVLNTIDLVEMIEEGKVFGAALDVLENEKLNSYSSTEKDTFDRLAAQPNVILTPHIGGWTFESYARINEVIVEKLNASFHH